MRDRDDGIIVNIKAMKRILRSMVWYGLVVGSICQAGDVYHRVFVIRLGNVTFDVMAAARSMPWRIVVQTWIKCAK